MFVLHFSSFDYFWGLWVWVHASHLQDHSKNKLKLGFEYFGNASLWLKLLPCPLLTTFKCQQARCLQAVEDY